MVDQATFVRYVREVFARLDDRPCLAMHPLASLLARAGQAMSPEALRATLLSSIDQLRPPEGTPPGSANWRRWRCLTLYYVDGLTTKQIAQRLHISDRQVRRDHLDGVDATAAVLWARCSRRAEAAGRPENRQREAGAQAGGLAPTPREDLEAELTSVSALAPGELCSLAQALEGALTTVRPLAEAHGAHIEVSLPEDPCPVAVSEPVLRQILICLLSAACEVEPTPTIYLVADSLPGFVQLAVSLFGVGGRAGGPGGPAGADEAKSLTEVARRLAESQGGDLQVEAASDVLRRVVLRLPASRMATVLVIDDNPDVIQLFRRYLAGSRYRFVQARTPTTALELARELHPDVITLDVMMPSQDGWQILQRLRSDPASCRIPVVVCSVLPEKALADSLGVAGFLAKPVTPQALEAALERCLTVAG